MKTRTLYPILCAALLALVAVGCQKEEDITPVTPDTTPVVPTYTSADLIPGPAFNDSLPEYYTAIRFVCGDTTVTSGTLLSTDSSAFPIYGNLDGTTWVVTTAADSMYANPNSREMFSGVQDETTYEFYSDLTSIEFGPGFSTTKVTNMVLMFVGCTELPGLDLSCFNTANVTIMGGMFGECGSLTALDFSTFNTTNVTDMSNMFVMCSSLTTLDLSSFCTDNLTSMEGMFSGCTNLQSIDVSSFNTSNVTNMSTAFGVCDVLTDLDLSHFNTSNVTDMSYMFAFSPNLANLDVSNFNTSNVETMYGMFFACYSLVDLDLSSFNTSKVTDMEKMFYDCFNIANLDISNFDMSHSPVKTAMCYHMASYTQNCTITCTAATQTALQSGTGLNSNLITWNIVE